MVTVRQAIDSEVIMIVKLSDEIIEDLRKQGHDDYFGGVDAEEVSESMKGESATFVAVDETGKIVGFILALKKEKSYCLNGYGVNPKCQGKGIAKSLVESVAAYALKNNVEVLSGTIHPDNTASRKCIQCVAEDYAEGHDFVHHMKDGRILRRTPFEVKLV